MSYQPNNANGQATSSASAPVVIASDQTSLTINQNDLSTSGNITILNSNPLSGTPTAGSTVVFGGVLVGVSTVSIQTVGTWTGLLTPQVSLDGTDWIAMNSTSLVNVTTGAYSATIPSAAKQIYQADIAGFAYFRVTATPTAMTGTATVYLRATNATGLVGIDNPLPPGTNALGSMSVSSGTITTVSTVTNPIKITGVASGGATTYLLISAATTNSTLISTGAHTLYSINAYNNGATAAYVKIYAKATAPTVGTDTPIKSIMLPAGGGSNIVLPTQGDVVALGLGLGITGGAANSDTTAVALSQVIFNCSYV